MESAASGLAHAGAVLEPALGVASLAKGEAEPAKAAKPRPREEVGFWVGRVNKRIDG